MLRISAFIANLILPPPIMAAEIGVYRGENAFAMLKDMPLSHLYLIDPYEKNLGYDWEQEKDNIYPADARKEAYSLIDSRENVTWIQLSSEEAAKKISILDYIYIDGDHRYDSVKKDIELWWPIVRPGGIIAGHDYHSTYRPDVHAGIDRAVDEFFANLNLVVNCRDLDWWVIKPNISLPPIY